MSEVSNKDLVKQEMINDLDNFSEFTRVKNKPYKIKMHEIES